MKWLKRNLYASSATLLAAIATTAGLMVGSAQLFSIASLLAAPCMIYMGITTLGAWKEQAK